MKQSQPIWEEELRVNAFECDPAGYWKPAAFFQHLTEIAGRHATQLGFGFLEMLEKDHFWVLSRFKIIFHAYPRPEDWIRVRTWPKTIQQKLFFIRDFQVETLDGKALASASSAWLVIDRHSRRMIPTSRLDLDLPHLPERQAVEESLEKISLAEELEERLQARAGYSALDVLGHVNNGRYVEWVCDTLGTERLLNQRPAWMQVNYINEVRPEEQIVIRTQHDFKNANPLCLEGYNLSSQSRAFEAQLGW